MIMLLLLKVLEGVAWIVSTLAVALAATANWVTLGASAPVVVATVGTALYYRHRYRRDHVSDRRNVRGKKERLRV